MVDDSYESLRLRFIRTQRDEIDAIEAFGTFIWDIRFKDFDGALYSVHTNPSSISAIEALGIHLDEEEIKALEEPYEPHPVLGF